MDVWCLPALLFVPTMNFRSFSSHEISKLLFTCHNFSSQFLVDLLTQLLSPLAACEAAAGTLGSSALGGFSASGTTQLGFCLASGAVAGFELGRGAPVSPRSSTSASGLSFVGSPVVSGAGGGLIPTTPRGRHAGARRMELVLPDNAVGYCFVRPNGTRTRLIPADMLPFSLQGVPTMEPDNSNLVELPIPAGMSPDGKNTNTSRLSLLVSFPFFLFSFVYFSMSWQGFGLGIKFG